MSDVNPDDTESRINEALVKFTGCIGEAFDDVCSYGLTLGDSYVPFDPDEDSECDPDEAFCSQVWVRVMDVSVGANSPESWEGGCELVLSLSIEVGVLRCVEIPDEGEAPTETDVLSAALQAMDDMRAILCAAKDCEVWNSIEVGTWSPYGPSGGQYGGTWTFTVEL